MDEERATVCRLCGSAGWYLDELGGEDELVLLPCPLPDCSVSGRRLRRLDVELAGFTRDDSGIARPIRMLERD